MSATVQILTYLVLGTAGGIALVRYAGMKTSAEERRSVFANALLVASFIYVAFAMAAFDDRWLFIEILGLLLFAGMVFIGSRRSYVWLVIGWLAHTVWDVALHIAIDVHFVPLWYPVACIPFDVVVALSIRRALAVSGPPAEAVA